MKLDPENLSAAQYRAAHRAAQTIRTLRLDAEVGRLHADALALDEVERAPLIPVERWDAAPTAYIEDPNDAPCVCYHGVGALAGKVTCLKTGCRNSPNGPRAVTVPCNPEPEGKTMTMMRSDATSRGTTRATKTPGRTRALRDALRVKLGDRSIRKADVRALIAARGGDSDVDSLSPDTARGLIRQGRARASEAIAARTVAAIPAAGTPVARTDAGELEREIIAARRERDHAVANAWRQVSSGPMPATRATRTDAAESTDIDRIRAERDRRMANAGR